MKLSISTCAAFCLLVAFVSGAEESADPPNTSGDIQISNPEQDHHGPLIKALLPSGEETLSRQKRTLTNLKYFGGGGGGGGGCCSSCGGCRQQQSTYTKTTSTSSSSATSEAGGQGKK